MAKLHAWLADNGTIVDGAHSVGLQAFASSVVPGGVFVGVNVARDDGYGSSELMVSFVTDVKDVEAFARALLAVADEAWERGDNDNG
jgi:hypothetical protein